MNTDPDAQLVKIIHLAQRAGAACMAVYSGDIAVETKADSSPVTAADGASEAIILEGLRRIDPQTPVIAEEAASAGHIPVTGTRFYLVDPLDGTREFISRNGEFTVNIALVEHGEPVRGVVYAPALGTMWWGARDGGAGMARLGIHDNLARVSWRPLQASKGNSGDRVRIVASRSHMDTATADFISRYPGAECVAAGSSLKFCLLAEGQADLYPRFGPTMQWDTAAGHGVLLGAGGTVLTPEGAAFLYGPRAGSFRNGPFVATAPSHAGPDGWALVKH